MPASISDGESGASVRTKLNTALGAVTDAGDINLISRSTTPTTPESGNLTIFGRSVGGRMMAAQVGPSGLDTSLQPHVGRNAMAMWEPSSNATATTNARATALTATGTATTANIATTNLHTMMKRVDFLVTAASTSAIAGFRYGTGQWSIGGGSAKLGGFHFICRWGPATGVSTSTNRCFVGMTSSTLAATDVEPSSLTNRVGMGWDAADANIQILHNDASGTCTKTSLGASFPVPTADRAHVYELAMFSPPGTTQRVDWQVTDLVTDAVATGSISTDVPTATTLLVPRGDMSVGGTSSVIGIALMGLYIETDY